MTSIRLLVPFRMHHHELPIGEVIGVRPDIARTFVGLGIAEYVEPLTAVVVPQETRILNGDNGEPGRRRPGRPPMQR